MNIRSGVVCIVTILFLVNCSSNKTAGSSQGGQNQGGTSAPATLAKPQVTLTSKSITTRNQVTFTITATSDVTGYYISESAISLNGNEVGWQSSAPSSYTLSSYGSYTLYFYVKNAEGTISDAATLTIQYVKPGTEITDGWPYIANGPNNDKDTVEDLLYQNGYLYVVGSGNNILTGNSKLSFWLTKIAADGTKQWDVQNYIASSQNHYALSLATDGSNIFLSGYYFASFLAGNNWFLRSYSAAGSEITTWSKTWDNSNTSDTDAYVQVASNGNIYWGGTTYDNGSSAYRWWLRVYDSSGNLIGQSGSYINCGSTLQLKLYDLVLSESENALYWIGTRGNSQSAIDSSNNWCIQKTDLSGTPSGGNFPIIVDGGDADVPYKLVLDSSGFFVIGSGLNLVSAGSGWDWWIKRYDLAGNEITANWDKKVDSGNGDDIAYDGLIQSGYLYVVGTGNAVASGSTTLDWWIKKFSLADGTEPASQWNVTIDDGDADNATSIVTDGNGYFYVGGYNNHTTTGNDRVVRKFIDEN
ncbi:MAG: hypothetical protein D6767_10855 [Candidatus Hydrogenedentota bacterium]|nr:MAG: hypothetical protein D6767_10855 [Candidatus Hydrogenedentota bacterium]